MRRLSANQNCHPGRTFEGDVEAVVRAGLQGIGVHRTKLEAVGVERAVRLLRDAGLGVAGYSATGWFLREGGRAAAIEDTRRCIDVAARLGASCVVLVTGPRGGLPWEEANARFIDALAEVLPFAAEHRMRLAVEPISGVRSAVSYLHLLSDALDVADQVDSPWFGVLLDVWYHWWQRDYAASVRRGIRRVFLVQVADHYPDAHSMRDRAPLGEGCLPLEATLGVIDAAGYDGWWDIEVFSPRLSDADHEALLPRSRAVLEEVWRRWDARRPRP